MGNIEIRDQQSVRRRTQIFSDRKSYDAARSEYHKSLTKRYEKSCYSPIRFSKLSDIPQDAPLTQRKPNTLPQYYNKKNISVLNQESLQNSRNPKNRQQFIKGNAHRQQFNKSPSHRQQLMKNLKLKNIQNQQQQQQNLPSKQQENLPSQQHGHLPSQQQEHIPLQKTGKIVSNSQRVQEERRSYLAFREIVEKDQGANSPLETKEIIRKVRNFNDFLNQIKRKLKEDKQQTLLRNKSRLEEFNRNHPSEQRFNLTLNNPKPSPLKQLPSPLKYLNQPQPITLNAIQKSKSMRRIQVALKLQNQKIQLQKYRKLVQRQLSKTHSIQNISLSTKNSGQKILTIHYESITYQNILNQNILNQNISPNHDSNPFLNKHPSQKTLINTILQNNDLSHHHHQLNHYQRQNHQSSTNKPLLPQNNQANMLKKLKIQYQKMLQNVLQLGKTIERYQMNDTTAESQVIDNKILIQEARNWAQKQSQASKRSTQHKVTQFNKTQTQCTKKGESQRSMNKVSQVSDKMVDDREEQKIKYEAGMRESLKQIERDRCSFDREGNRGSKVVSQSSTKQGQVRRQVGGETKEEILSSQNGSGLNNEGSRINKRGSQPNNKGINSINQSGQNKDQKFWQLKQHCQDISFANRSSHQAPFSTSLQQKIKQRNLKPLQSGHSKQKISRIESLFDRLNDLQDEYQETDREVREAIGDQTESYSQIQDGSGFIDLVQ